MTTFIASAAVPIEHNTVSLGPWSTACTCPVLQVKDYVEDPLNLVGKIRTRTSNELLKVPAPDQAAFCTVNQPCIEWTAFRQDVPWGHVTLVLLHSCHTATASQTSANAQLSCVTNLKAGIRESKTRRQAQHPVL